MCNLFFDVGMPQFFETIFWNERAMWCLENGNCKSRRFLKKSHQSPSIHPVFTPDQPPRWVLAILLSDALLPKTALAPKQSPSTLSVCCIQHTNPLFCWNKFISTYTNQFRHVLDLLTQGNFKVFAFSVPPRIYVEIKPKCHITLNQPMRLRGHRTTWNMASCTSWPSKATREENVMRTKACVV